MFQNDKLLCFTSKIIQSFFLKQQKTRIKIKTSTGIFMRRLFLGLLSFSLKISTTTSSLTCMKVLETCLLVMLSKCCHIRDICFRYVDSKFLEGKYLETLISINMGMVF